jgi:nucleoside-diphosphate-sugar epimerase
MPASTSPQRIVFTGGSGKAGRHVIPYLISKGHSVLNLDLLPHPDPSVFTIKTDLTNSGSVFNALTSPFSMSEYSLPSLPPPTAVIHFAAYARNHIVPDNETFHDNATSTYNVIEAACKMGIKKIIIASSETVYGVCFTQGEDPQYQKFPLEETDDVNPEDTYALTKLVGERIARTFVRRYRDQGVDIYALRIANVIEPHEYKRDFPGYIANPAVRKRNAWSYIDARDLGQICDGCLRVSGRGFEVFNAVNSFATIEEEDVEGWLRNKCPETDIIGKLGKRESPFSNRKIREVLGFRDAFDWRVEMEK